MTKDFLLRGIGVLACLAVLFGIHFLLRSTALEERANRDELAERLGDLSSGRRAEDIHATAGAPDLICGADAEQLQHLGEYAAIRKNPAALKRLVASTRERWVYFCSGPTFRKENRGQCLPASSDAELGFDEEGKLLWVVLGTLRLL